MEKQHPVKGNIVWEGKDPVFVPNEEGSFRMYSYDNGKSIVLTHWETMNYDVKKLPERKVGDILVGDYVSISEDAWITIDDVEPTVRNSSLPKPLRFNKGVVSEINDFDATVHTTNFKLTLKRKYLTSLANG